MIHNDNAMITLEKNRIDKNRIDNTIGDKKLSPVHELTEYFFSLKGDEYLEEQKTKYGRHTKDAKDLLELAGSLEAAKSKLEKVGDWADGNGLEWNISTAVKKWLEIDSLKV